MLYTEHSPSSLGVECFYSREIKTDLNKDFTSIHKREVVYVDISALHSCWHKSQSGHSVIFRPWKLKMKRREKELWIYAKCNRIVWWLVYYTTAWQFHISCTNGNLRFDRNTFLPVETQILHSNEPFGFGFIIYISQKPRTI